MKERSWARPFAAAAFLAAASVLAPTLRAQTLTQVLQLGSDVGPRLTRAVARARIGEPLFGAIAQKITLIDGVGTPTAYSFASDPLWHRIIFGKMGDYVRAFDNTPAPLVSLESPRGLDVSTQRTLFIADALNGRVLLSRFDPGTKSITALAEAQSPGGLPLDVAWDGGTTPVTNGLEAFYVVDGSGQLSYWSYASGAPHVQWVFGSYGGGTGQFRDPSGVCVGHALASNGGTVFTSDIYVADAGNLRLVWLRRSGAGASWMGSVQLAQNGVPVDCTVDQFGNVYVVDRRNSRILKYTSSLGLLAQYGSYGRGANNYQTLSHPHAIHTPYGLRVVGGTTVYYGEGRVVTAEDWTDSSGALEHWLGLDLQAPYAPLGGTGWASVPVWMTDHAYVTVEVLLDANFSTVANPAASDFRPSGWVSVDWNGLLSDGTAAPQDWYRFRVRAVSGYGCDGSAWCDKTLITDRFLASGRDCTDPNFICPTENMVALLPGLGGAGGLPTTFFLHQLVSAYAGPLARRVDVAEDLRGLRGDPAQPGTLSAQVRARGLMALAVGVPAATTATPLTVRVYSLNGTLVRELVRESVDPGEYVVGWDGTDRDGRPVLPGVYIAVMSAGSFRGTQRLIVPRR